MNSSLIVQREETRGVPTDFIVQSVPLRRVTFPVKHCEHVLEYYLFRIRLRESLRYSKNIVFTEISDENAIW